LIEKPLAATVAEAEELVRAARWHNVVLQVGHIERFNPALLPLLSRLVRPRYIEAIRQGPYSFRSTDISVVLDLMIHDLDIALWLTGGANGNPVRSVAAIGWTVMGGEEDFAQAHVEFADGCVANLTASRVSHRPRRQMQLWTADAQIEIDFNTRRSTIVEIGGNLNQPIFNLSSPSTTGAQPADRRFETLLPLRELEAAPQNALLEEQRDFVECIRTGREPRVTGEAGLAAIETAERVLVNIAASRQGRSAVDLPAAISPRTMPTTPAILRGPHWDHLPQHPLRRKEAG
jgi:predicted dehydrogenase